MLGYLSAAQAGAHWIRETDDDNDPNESFFASVPSRLSCRVPSDQSSWVNIYAHFTDRHVWPRGFPLSLVNADSPWTLEASGRTVSGPYILQAVANGDPDVDAIYRLTAADTSDIEFDSAEPLVLPEGCWSPFNSQATTWPRVLFPLMYLPVTCSFRMTDIWRSFVVQRLLPGLGASLVVTSATVHQDRNEHDLLADFAQEVSGYLGTERIREVLEGTPISGGPETVAGDLRVLYRALVREGFLAEAELPALDAWLADVTALELVPG